MIATPLLRLARRMWLGSSANLLIAYSLHLALLQAQTVEHNPFAQNVSLQASSFFKEAVYARKAMVVSAHPVASQVGADILRKGGNAFDAAVAVQFTLAVVYPVAGNIGGGGFAVGRLRDGRTFALDFRETAPILATRDMFLDSAGNVIPFLSTHGHKASGIPGTVDGMVQLHKQYGKLPWKVLVQPAINIARQGVFLTMREAAGLNTERESIAQYNPGKSYFLKPNKALWQAGDLLIQEDLARTLERIRDKGREGFYRGKTAELIIAEMKRGGGLIQQKDLDLYSAQWRTPLRGKYRGYDIITMPPPSAGGVGLLQMLSMLEPYPLREWGVNTEKSAHCMIEVERRSYADRNEYLGDPDFQHIPLKGLLNPQYVASRMRSFNPDRATPSSELSFGRDVHTYESDQTTHFSIVDAYGNAIAVTTTINGAFGSRVVVDGAGFFLNNEMDDFSAKAGVPNMFGVVGSTANEIQPRKRMLSSMTPTILEKEGKLFCVLGTPGGTTITTSVLQTIINIIDHGMTGQQSVNTKRFHHQYLPDVVRVEPGAFTPETEAALQAKGHTLRYLGAIGKVEVIVVRPDGSLEGAADPRGDDTAVGF
ncbi:MAG: gamma-glutamyltransferase [Bacteroidota bacterium]|nr:gamma-glutamyltransferase [Candidatus Kapabacteria bacterium]MDW8220102.1 gamma-glutamyltransferase [Bacteroidota bacterium]